MMSRPPAPPGRLILDVDGVLLDERPYWDAALASALLHTGLAEPAVGNWRAVCAAAFDDAALQQAVKAAGVNSNWDLAAVLAAALRVPGTHEAVRRDLAARRFRAAMERLRRAVTSSVKAAPEAGADPLAAWDIRRDDPDHRRLVARFQQVLAGIPPGFSIGPRDRLRESAAVVRKGLAACVAAGWEPGICTGRPRVEIISPLATLGLAPWFGDRIVCAQDVASAEQQSGSSSFSKPHAFPVLCAALGADAAMAACRNGKAPRTPQAIVYVGDAPADHQAAAHGRSLGLPVDYIHRISPAVSAAVVARIARSAFTLRTIDSLAALATLLQESRS